MSVALCIETAGPMPASVILGVLRELVELNVSIYERGFVRRAPWSYIWIPDPVVVCDGDECRLANVSKQQDVALVDARGQGSCGPLACAYASWLIFDEKKAADIELLPNGRNRWHIRAIVGSTIYDPQRIGARTRTVQHGNV